MIKENKLISILDSFTTGDLKAFRSFLKWKVRPSERYVIPLLEKLSNKKWRGKSDTKQLHAILFPGKKFQEQHIYTAYSDLLVYVKQFLALEHICKHETEQELLYIAELESRNTEGPLLIEQKAFLKSWDNQPMRHSEKYLELFELYEIADRNFMKKQKREFDPALQEKVDALDTYYFSTKLREACEVINRHTIIGDHYTLRFIEEIVAFTDREATLSDQPSIAVYATIWKMITTDQENHFFHLKDLLKTLAAFPAEEGRNIVNYGMNFCIRKINTGKPEYLQEAFDLYMFQLESGIIFEKRYMTQWDYKNIITVAIRLKKYDWTEDFINTYKDRIEPAFRENAWNYNLANFYYEKEEYRKAIRILNSVNFTDVYYALSARSLLLKIYYEQEEFDMLISLADTFKMYLNRNKKISAYQKTIHLNLVKYIKKASLFHISGYSEEKRKKTQKTVLEKLASETSVANINWVRQVWKEI